MPVSEKNMKYIDTKQMIEWLMRVDAQKAGFTVDAGNRRLQVSATKQGEGFSVSISLDELEQRGEILVAQMLDNLENRMGVPIAERIEDIGKRTRPFPAKEAK